MKKIAILLLLMIFSTGIAQAKVLRLNSGETVEGSVVEETDEYFLLQVNGFMMTYYKDEVTEAVDKWTDLSNKDGGSASDVMAELDNAVYGIQQVAAGQANDTGSFETKEVQLTAKEQQLIDQMDKKDLILRFMDVFGTRATLKATYQQMMSRLTPEQVKAVNNTITVEGIVEQLLPLYDRYFTTEELRKYVAFYSSVEGRKLLRTVPLLMQESVKTSMEYFQQNLPASVR